MINTQLLQLGTAKMDGGFSTLTQQSDRIMGITEETQDTVARIETSVITQEGVLTNLGMTIPRMIAALANEIRMSWSNVIQVLNRVC